MRVVDVLLGLPGLVLALALVGTLGPSLGTLMLALVFAQSPWYIRLVRTMVLRGAGAPLRPGGQGARGGPPGHRLAPRPAGGAGAAGRAGHARPGQRGAGGGRALLLGLGVQPPGGVGAMLNDEGASPSPSTLLMIVPGACIFCTVLCANLLGDALRDVLDPTWGGHRG